MDMNNTLDYPQRVTDNELYDEFGIATDEFIEYVEKTFGFKLHKSKKVQMNNILRTDSYKFSHWVQYPKGTTDVFSYIESRGCEFTDKLMFFGLQAYLKEYLSKPVTMADVEYAAKYCASRYLPFNYEGWKYIVEKHKGYLPLTIKAANEGAVIPLKNVLLTIHTTDPNCFWLPSYVETALLRAVWYPSTVASLSYTCKEIIYKYLTETCDNPDEAIKFALHDFGARGVSSGESAALGGMGHIINFFGTDTDEAVVAAQNYYNVKIGADTISLAAAEHSTITSWTRPREYDAYENMVDQYAKPGAIFAVVCDSYNIWEAIIKMWHERGLFDRVKAAGARVVIRPDSGDATIVPIKIIKLIAELEGYTVNKKGYKVLPDHIRVIQGDGITIKSIPIILENLKKEGFSVENLAFGMGGGLLQHVNRDTFAFAQKCCAALVNGEWVDVYKQPVDGNGKMSKAGRMTLIKDDQGVYHTIRLEDPLERKEELEIVFKNGRIVKETTFDEVRKRAHAAFVN
jgi:nicotinamide phosphoribosyltransferase